MTIDDLARARRARASAFLERERKSWEKWSDLTYEYDYTPEGAMTYLGWFDDNVKKTTAEKVGEAIAAYVARFSAAPNIVLVNEADRGVEIAGMTVRSEGYIRRNNFWVGFEYGYEA